MNRYTKVYLSKIAKSSLYKWGGWIGSSTVKPPTPDEETSSDFSWIKGPLVNAGIRTGIRLALMAGVIAYSYKQLKEKKKNKKKKKKTNQQTNNCLI